MAYLPPQSQQQTSQETPQNQDFRIYVHREQGETYQLPPQIIQQQTQEAEPQEPEQGMHLCNLLIQNKF